MGGGRGRVRARAQGLPPLPLPWEQKLLVWASAAGFELGQRENGVERGEPLPPHPRESRGDSLLPADALVLG